MPSMDREPKRSRYQKLATDSYTYIDGSAARKLEAAPQIQPRKEEKKQPKKHSGKQTRVRTAERALPMNAFSVLVLAAAIVTTLYMCIRYVQLQSEITYRIRSINEMELQLADLTSMNDETEKRINTYVDLAYIYQQATEVLGMRYPAKEQIEWYSNSGAEYARQYEQIPEVPKKMGILIN